jgi:hypothetical protein
MSCAPYLTGDDPEITDEMREKAFASAEADLRDAIALAKKHDVPTICLPQVIDLYTSHLSGQRMAAQHKLMKERDKRRREKMRERMKGMPGVPHVTQLPGYAGGYVGTVPMDPAMFDDDDDI